MHVDSCELRSAQGKVHLFLAIDRVSEFTNIALHEGATMHTGAAFLLGAIAAFPYAIDTVLTDNGVAFADQPRYRAGPTAKYRGHLFDRVCRTHGIGDKVTRPYHPRTNRQAERMIRRVNDATVNAFTTTRSTASPRG